MVKRPFGFLCWMILQTCSMDWALPMEVPPNFNACMSEDVNT